MDYNNENPKERSHENDRADIEIEIDQLKAEINRGKKMQNDLMLLKNAIDQCDLAVPFDDNNEQRRFSEAASLLKTLVGTHVKMLHCYINDLRDEISYDESDKDIVVRDQDVPGAQTENK